MAAYTDPTKISAYLGVTFTAEQTTVAESVASGVTGWIDHRTGWTWQDADGSVTDEIHEVIDSTVYLTYTPVTAVSEVHVRARQGATLGDWVLLDPTDYQLVDPSTGLLALNPLTHQYAERWDARVDYTSSVTAPPADIEMAATILSASLMSSPLHPGTAGLSSIAVGQNDVAVAFAQVSESSQPLDVKMAFQIVYGYRRPVLA